MAPPMRRSGSWCSPADITTICSTTARGKRCAISCWSREARAIAPLIHAGAETEHGNRSLALDIELAQRLAVEGRGNLVEDFLGGGDAAGRAHADHARRDVDRIA